MNILNFEETVKLIVKEYPDLFWASTMEKMKWNVSEYLFNTIGTGFNNAYGLEKFLDNEKSRAILNDKTKDFLFEKQKCYVVFDKKTYENIAFLSSEDKSEYELGNNEKLILLKDKPIRMYPNFSKSYSFFYDMKKAGLLDKLDISWFEAMRDFYIEAKELINNPNADYEYQLKPPNDLSSVEWGNMKDAFLKAFERYKENKTTNEWYQIISKEYRHPFDGDIDKFLLTKWDKEKVRINSFIDETLMGIDEQINLRKETTYKKKISLN